MNGHVSGAAKLLSRFSLHESVIKTIYVDEIIVNIEVFFKSSLKNSTQKLKKKTNHDVIVMRIFWCEFSYLDVSLEANKWLVNGLQPNCKWGILG